MSSGDERLRQECSADAAGKRIEGILHHGGKCEDALKGDRLDEED